MHLRVRSFILPLLFRLLMNNDDFRQRTINTVVPCIQTNCSTADAQTIICLLSGVCPGGPYLSPHLSWNPLINVVCTRNSDYPIVRRLRCPCPHWPGRHYHPRFRLCPREIFHWWVGGPNEARFLVGPGRHIYYTPTFTSPTYCAPRGGRFTKRTLPIIRSSNSNET